MTRGFFAIVILALLDVCRTYAPAANPPMLTHASMDVGNIISIVIPESPDENINIDQLTGEFRQQLERIKKQSRASKVEHGLVTLKRVLPEMSREEKRKTLPLIRRVLHGRRVANPSTVRNFTRDPRLEQLRESAQFVRSRSAGGPEERRMHRDYEESVVREAAATRFDQTATDKDEYRRTYASRRDDFPGRDETLRQDRVPFPDEEPQSSRISRTGPGQDWGSNWDDQYRPDGRAYPESSTADCNYKLERTVRQKDPGNEIVHDRYDKPSRPREPAPSGPDDNPACAKPNQGIAAGYPSVSRPETGESSKRNVKDSRGYETGDSPAYASFPRDFEANAPVDPNCDNARRNNGSAQLLRDPERSRGDSSSEKLSQRQELVNPEPEDFRYFPKSLQDPHEQPERSNASGLDNAVNEGDDYAAKKKRGQSYGEEVRVPPMTPPVDRWNGAIYEDRGVSNSSDEPRDSPGAYEIFGEKSANPGLSYMQTEQGGFRRNLDKTPKNTETRMMPNYGAEGLALRIQRAVNESRYEEDTGKLPINVTESSIEDLDRMAGRNIFEHLKRLFKAPQSPQSQHAYDRVIVVYGGERQGKVERIPHTFTEDGRSLSTLSPSMAEPSASTRQDGPVSTTDYVGKLRVLPKI